MRLQISRLIHIYPRVSSSPHIIVFLVLHVVLHVLGLLILARLEGLLSSLACSLNRWQRR